MRCKILRLFVNTFTADDKYCFLNGGNLTQHIQMHLSQKEKDFCELFGAFLKSTSTPQHFEKENPHSLCISEFTDSKKRG